MHALLDRVPVHPSYSTHCKCMLIHTHKVLNDVNHKWDREAMTEI